jgi:hypothetical protein
MLQSLSVSDLYPFALAEGEGVGTAYEYLAKRLILDPWLRTAPTPQRILIGGLPEKYGCSLDFALMAAEFGAHLTIADERPAALEKFEASLASAQKDGRLSALSWTALLAPNLNSIPADHGPYDLALSSEALQRLYEASRSSYFANLQRVARRLALFCPNASNPAHTNLSGLNGVTKEELGALAGAVPYQTGFIDMPPFPPGLTRTDEQREQATTGRMEALAMFGLGAYARLERFVPERIRRQQSHIVYAFS